MDIKNAKELGRVADMCRKKGIAEFKATADSIEIKLWDVIPERPRRRSRKAASQETAASSPEEFDPVPSQEELLFWSSPSPEAEG